MPGRDGLGGNHSGQTVQASPTFSKYGVMPYEAALADIELAASYPAGSPERLTAATRALASLESNGASFDAGRARSLLSAG